MSQRLQGHIAVVTGGDSGIGAAIVDAFAREGADVALTWYSDNEGADTSAARALSYGVRALALQANQRDDESVTRLFARVQSELRAPTLLVNNAGLQARQAPLAKLRRDEWQQVLRTDLEGPFLCCQAFLRALGADRRGQRGASAKIINITSIHAEAPMWGASAYGAAKAGVANLTRTLALELAQRRINVNAIAPGMILTPMNAAAMDNPEVLEEHSRCIPWGRPGEPEEVAELAVFLASPAADYITGQSLVIDGGLMLRQATGA